MTKMKEEKCEVKQMILESSFMMEEAGWNFHLRPVCLFLLQVSQRFFLFFYTLGQILKSVILSHQLFCSL